MRAVPAPHDDSRPITLATTAPATAATFADLGLCPEIVDALAGLGYEEPTPIQREAIPPLVAGRDLLGNAATGTGKTAAFALPVLHHLSTAARESVAALVLVPTRELAIQVSDAVTRYGQGLGARVVAVYGGQPIGRQIHALRRADVVVATPGRALDHIRRGSLQLDGVRTLVLDEADEMLDMGFADDLAEIIAAAPAERQTVLFSATLPGRIVAIARTHLTDPVRVQVAREPVAEGAEPRVDQAVYVLRRDDKAPALCRLLDVQEPTATIVFCRTRTEVEELTEILTARGHRAEALHGGMAQEQRDRVMARVRARAAGLLVATDVAARGLDINHLTHVVNYDVPSSPESYVHRIGRVGRAGREGVAITLAEPREMRLIGNVERVLGHPIARRPVPSVSELRARRRDALAERLSGAAASVSDDARALMGSLTDGGLEPGQVALAALELLCAAAGPSAGERDIVEPATRRPDRPEPRPRSTGAGPRSREPRIAGDTAQVFIGAGRAAGVRPQDLVGAVAGESGLAGRDVGAISIFDRFSLVEVPAPSAEKVIEALRAGTIRGRKVAVRRGHAPGEGPARTRPDRRPRPDQGGRGR